MHAVLWSLSLLLATAPGTPADATPPSASGAGDEATVGEGAPAARPRRIILRGSLPRAQIEAQLRAALPSIRSCYEQRLHERPELGAISIRVATTFVIGPEGNVISYASVWEGAEDEALARCVQREVESVRFPKPDGGGPVRIDCPFEFPSAPRREPPPSFFLWLTRMLCR